MAATSASDLNKYELRMVGHDLTAMHPHVEIFLQLRACVGRTKWSECRVCGTHRSFLTSTGRKLANCLGQPSQGKTDYLKKQCQRRSCTLTDMPQVKTHLTDSLSVNVPIIVPPMAGATGGKLAAEVTLAGGFGFIGVGYMDKAAFMQEIGVVRSILTLPPEAPLAVGAGFLCWILDQGGAPVEALNAALEQRVKAVWLSFGNDMGKWVDHVRDYDARRAVSHKTAMWVLVSSVKEAERAVNEWKPDVLVVQGGEAGGHGVGDALPLLSLFPLVKQALPNGPPLVAAGGIANGAQAAALLVLGAAGAIIGTRYLATPESTYTTNQKNAVVSASYSIRTTAFDTARGTVGWPEGVDGRGLPNKTVEDASKGIPVEEQKKAYDEASKKDDVSRVVVWSGASVALVNEIIGAGELTRKLGEELVQTLRQAQSLIKED